MLSHAVCVRVCACLCLRGTISISPIHRPGWQRVVQGRKEKGTMNDIDRQRAAERLPRSRDTELIADSRCVPNCGGVGRPGYVSVSSVCACQEAKPPPEPPITASN